VEFSSEQKFERSQGVGASEVGVILGLDDGFWDAAARKKVKRTWKDLLLEKTGQGPPYEENQYSEWGHRMEPVIAEWYTDTHGGVAEKSPLLWSPRWSFAFCSPDRVIVRDSEKHGLEIKNRSNSKKSDWKEGPPPMVDAQARWSMLVTEWDRWDIAVLINGNDARAYTLHRDLDWEAMALAEVSRFWEKVEQANRELWG
jgi:putative phage-type endonuclease